jgi:hypothetical protein
MLRVRDRKRTPRLAGALLLLLSACNPFSSGRDLQECAPANPEDLASAPSQDALYPDEEILDASVHPDEALVNVALANHRWPDCSTDRTAILDIFRLEGAKTDQAKALALWKWFRILVSATGGYEREGEAAGQEELVQDPHKILTVYGHGQCDSMSWSMAPLWRAAGYIAFDECHLGHTISSLRYRDDDGELRFHDLDPQGRFVHWDSEHQRIGTWSMPLMRGLVHRHLVAPQNVHTLRTSLRIGETLERRWDNGGHVAIGDKPPKKIDPDADPYYRYSPGRQDGVYASAGEEVQSLVADLSPEHFDQALYGGRGGLAASGGLLHPEKQSAEAVYRIPSPYVAIEGTCEAVLEKGDPSDVCRLWLSRDGKTWKILFDKQKEGKEKVAIGLGRAARAEDRPHVYGAYPVFIKAEFTSAGHPEAVGMKALRVSLYRQLNKRTLPNLLPGENVLKISADRIAPGWLLELEIGYSLHGKAMSVVERTSRFPHYFKITVPEATPRVLSNYDRDFNSGDLRMGFVQMKLAPSGPAEDHSLPEQKAAAAFLSSSPHPANLLVKKEVKSPETDLMQVSGFFPQSRAVWTDREKLTRLLEKFQSGGTVERWIAAEDLGNYPESVDTLLKALPEANIDLTLFIVKALAQIGDKRAVGPLLEKWKRAPGGAPGTRYIPDALAAIGDPTVVPALVKPIHSCRFDYRFHIAHALGILGGPLAEKTLKDLSENDPFPGVREEARDALKRVDGRR